MDLILIACCKEKQKGGTPNYSAPPLAASLPKNTHLQLLQVRYELATRLRLPLGQDLSGDFAQEEILFMPAYRRYTGKVYTRAEVARLYPKTSKFKLAIISALYGLLDADDPIRYYDLVMDQTLPNGSRLATWWKNHALGKIVEEYVLALKPGKVHDLLSGSYRIALDPWPAKSFQSHGIEYVPYEYPGEGTGSLWHRGDDLKKILSN